MIDVMLAKRAYEGKFANIEEIIKCVPQLTDMNWIAEWKYDGNRGVLIKDINGFQFISRSDKTNLGERYPEIIEEAKKLIGESFILDGELVAYNKEGEEEFTNSRMTPESKKKYNFIFWVFDIVERDGFNLASQPLHERKRQLEFLFDNTSSMIQRTVPYFDKIQLLRKAKEDGLEGIILKDMNAPYEFGKRSKFWLKVKNEKTADVVVMGWIAPDLEKMKTEKRIGKFSALKCYQYDKYKNVLEVCKVGGGFKDDDLEYITTVHLVEDGKVRAPFIIEIKYLNITKDGHYRMPNFMRLREDKELKDCVMEKEIKRSTLDRWVK
jgi:bifunctional non-homologous end joining protein LigD